jgi:hypothetical protein
MFQEADLPDGLVAVVAVVGLAAVEGLVVSVVVVVAVAVPVVVGKKVTITKRNALCKIRGHFFLFHQPIRILFYLHQALPI